MTKAWPIVCALWLASACSENERFEDMRAGARPLTGVEARAELRGAFEGTYDELSFSLCLDDDGRARGRMGTLYDTGAYRVTREGLLCLRWDHWFEGHEGCAQYTRWKSEFIAYEFPTGRRLTRGRKQADAHCSESTKRATPAQREM